MLRSNAAIEGCHAICLTGCSWTNTEVRPGADSESSAQIQTTFGRVCSTVARSVPSALNAMIDTPRGGPVGSGIVAVAEGPDTSVYSRSPSVFINRSRQILGEYWSTWVIWASDIEQVN